MSSDEEQVVPYAPFGCVIAVIKRLRERGLPDELNMSTITRVGVSEGNASRTLVALRFLNLIDEEGHRTAIFDRLGRAPTAEYPKLLAEIIEAAYRDVFAILDPTTADDTDFVDAFRNYTPRAQHDRMIRLFRALCQEAGIIGGAPPITRKRQRSAPSGKPSPSPSNNNKRPPQPKSDHHSQVEEDQTPAHPIDPPMPNQDFALVRGLISELPTKRQWTQKDRQKWLNAVTALVDLHIKVVDPAPEAGDMYRE